MSVHSNSHSENTRFDFKVTLDRLRHYLPDQSPLKDFIHHNTLHAFQHESFHDALHKANVIFGYRTYMNLAEYRELYGQGRISETVLDWVISSRADKENISALKEKMLYTAEEVSNPGRIGRLRNQWKIRCGVNLDKEVHASLFRLTGGYLDQGVAIWNFPVKRGSLLGALREIERQGKGIFIKSPRARRFLFNPQTRPEDMLHLLVGDESLYERYLFDQQFAHPGWSGMVAVLEKRRNTLLDPRHISLQDFVMTELMLEVDALDRKFGENWAPLSLRIPRKPAELFAPVETDERFEVLKLWQEAFEWSYFDQVLAGIRLRNPKPKTDIPSFQALFCIDDRECSIRRYVEQCDPQSRTYGTPGFFNVPFYFRPEHGKFSTKLCPAPVNPKHLIKEYDAGKRHKADTHFAKQSHGILGGWLISQSLGFWSAVKLAVSIFFPGKTAAMVSSFDHMDPKGKLTIENKDPSDKEDGLQVGFTQAEMADSVEGQLRSIGLLSGFAPLIYVIGHGASSVNNTHYAGYDCGACSGRPGSVNARVLAFMGNHPAVREILARRGIHIPAETQFLGGLHDTTRDEIFFYDEEVLNAQNRKRHRKNMAVFSKALSLNAKERSRRFVLMNHRAPAAKIHKKVKLRSVSLFEPRPELNHATNALCLVGLREMSDHLFLDRRSFLNSYDASQDPDGNQLFSILRAVAPVCGGINLEYYFSRTDNSRLGAGSKLPHNVMGLIGVTNGMDGDLRTGLPSQMIEIHDPLRLLVVVEQKPEVVDEVIRRDAATFEWFANQWVKLVAVHPVTREQFLFTGSRFEPYEPLQRSLPTAENLAELIESEAENFPVFELKKV